VVRGNGQAHERKTNKDKRYWLRTIGRRGEDAERAQGVH